MRWELLFGDLEAQMHAATHQDLEHHINELARVESSQLTLTQALRGALDRPVSLVMKTGTAFHGQLRRVEPEWVLLDEGGRSVLLPLALVQRVQGLGPQRAVKPSKIPYTLSAALRVLARNRSALVIELDGMSSVILRGVIDQVGTDYFQLMQLSDGVTRDSENLRGSIVVLTAALVSVASSSDNDF